jgi:MFS family permease
MGFKHDIATSRAPLMGFIAMGIFWGVWSALIPQLKANIGADDGELGQALVFVGLGAIPAMIVGGRLSDRCGAWLLPLSITLFAIASVLPAIATTPANLAVLLFGLGAASGFMDVVMNGRVSVLEGRTGVPLMQLNHGSFAITFFAAAVLTGALREQGIDVTTTLSGTGAVVMLLALASSSRNPAAGPETKSPAPKRRLSVPVTLFGLIALTAFLAENGMQSWSALHLERTLGADPKTGGLGPGLLALAIAVGRFSGQGLGRRLSDGMLLTGAALIGVSGALIIGAASSPAMALSGLMVCGAGISVIAPAAFSLAGRSVPESRRGSAIATAGIVAYSGFFVGPAVLGFVSQHFGLPVAFFAIAAIVAAVPLLWLATRLNRG